MDSEAEEIYSSNAAPDPSKALDVLAFVLAPSSAFIGPHWDPEEVAAVEEILFEAKTEAIERWRSLQKGV